MEKLRHYAEFGRLLFMMGIASFYLVLMFALTVLGLADMMRKIF